MDLLAECSGGSQTGNCIDTSLQPIFRALLHWLVTPSLHTQLLTANAPLLISQPSSARCSMPASGFGWLQSLPLVLLNSKSKLQGRFSAVLGTLVVESHLCKSSSPSLRWKQSQVQSSLWLLMTSPIQIPNTRSICSFHLPPWFQY